jgi:hypothetical protein
MGMEPQINADEHGWDRRMEFTIRMTYPICVHRRSSAVQSVDPPWPPGHFGSPFALTVEEPPPATANQSRSAEG